MDKDAIPDTKCPKCNRECIFKWHEFSNGTRHIEQRCPVHKHLRWAPKIEPYLSLANANKADDTIIQKKLFD